MTVAGEIYPEDNGENRMPRHSMPVFTEEAISLMRSEFIRNGVDVEGNYINFPDYGRPIHVIQAMLAGMAGLGKSRAYYGSYHVCESNECYYYVWLN
jgi:hypothetical protein